jgi:DNA adenine methylase
MTSVRPLLKWAGGKRQLLPALRPYYPASFSRYFEPFLGSGAVFFDLHRQGCLAGRIARLTDTNVDLVGCYRMVRDASEEVITALRKLETAHHAKGPSFYYEVRDSRFNPARTGPLETRYTPELAAMFIYLNRAGYNGLFRLNRSGGFNVPAGRYTNPTICDAEHIRGVAQVLSHPGVSIECVPFDAAIADAAAGDFIYCDPPYVPLSRTASFAQYTAAGFDATDQARLQASVVRAASRGAILLVSNSTAPEAVAAYQAQDARRAGLLVRRVPARRAINSRAALRGAVDELIVTNLHVSQRNKLPMVKAHLPHERRARVAAGH